MQNETLELGVEMAADGGCEVSLIKSNSKCVICAVQWSSVEQCFSVLYWYVSQLNHCLVASKLVFFIEYR